MIQTIKLHNPRNLHSHAAADAWSADWDQRLEIITAIEPGFGVVPVLGYSCALIRSGDVAVYREERPHDVVPGFYCLERQRPVVCSPRPDSPRHVTREVVFILHDRRVEGSWQYISMNGMDHRGQPRPALPEGPLYAWALSGMVLGPIVGVYVPLAIAKEF